MESDLKNVLSRGLKYLVEGLAVGVAAFYIPKNKLKFDAILVIAVTAAAAFAVLDILAPSVGTYARQGSGFVLGAGLVGAPSLPTLPNGLTLPGVPML